MIGKQTVRIAREPARPATTPVEGLPRPVSVRRGLSAQCRVPAAEAARIARLTAR